MLCHPPSPISTPPALPSPLHAALHLYPSLPVSLHTLVSPLLPPPALSLSLLWVNRDELLDLKSMSPTVAGMRKGCGTTIANHGVKFDAGALTDGEMQQGRLFLWPGSSMHHVVKSTWTSFLCGFCQGLLFMVWARSPFFFSKTFKGLWTHRNFTGEVKPLLWISLRCTTNSYLFCTWRTMLIKKKKYIANCICCDTTLTFE